MAGEEETTEPVGFFCSELEPVVLVEMVEDGRKVAVAASEAERLILGGEAIEAVIQVMK